MVKSPANFLYLGGDKCGSTWIHHILSQHPDVTLATSKELFYFDRFYHKGAAWYRRQFPDITTDRVGEICHDYLYSEPALRRIAADLPQDARFLITVRDPLERTRSHYQYLRKIGRTNDSFEAALDAQPQIIEHSLFGKYVDRAQQILGADRVHVLPFEMLRRDPVQFGRAMSEALDISFLPHLPYGDRVLEAKSARNPALVALLRNLGWVMRHAGAPQLVGAVKTHPLTAKLLFSDRGLASQALHLSASSQAALADRFAPDQEKLAQLVPDMTRGLA